MRQLFFAALFAFAPALARAECMDLHDFTKQETAGDDKYVDTFSFRRDHRADSVLMLVNIRSSAAACPIAGCSCIATIRRRAPIAWSAAASLSVSIRTCRRMRPPTISGRPASGLPRCASSNADFTAEEQLRRLGQSRVGFKQHPLCRFARGPGIPIRHRLQSGLDHHRGRSTTSPVSTIAVRT